MKLLGNVLSLLNLIDIVRSHPDRKSNKLLNEPKYDELYDIRSTNSRHVRRKNNYSNDSAMMRNHSVTTTGSKAYLRRANNTGSSATANRLARERHSFRDSSSTSTCLKNLKSLTINKISGCCVSNQSSNQTAMDEEYAYNYDDLLDHDVRTKICTATYDKKYKMADNPRLYTQENDYEQMYEDTTYGYAGSSTYTTRTDTRPFFDSSIQREYCANETLPLSPCPEYYGPLRSDYRRAAKTTRPLCVPSHDSASHKDSSISNTNASETMNSDALFEEARNHSLSSMNRNSIYRRTKRGRHTKYGDSPKRHDDQCNSNTSGGTTLAGPDSIYIKTEKCNSNGCGGHANINICIHKYDCEYSKERCTNKAETSKQEYTVEKKTEEEKKKKKTVMERLSKSEIARNMLIGGCKLAASAIDKVQQSVQEPPEDPKKQEKSKKKSR